MSQSEDLPDTLTPNTPLILDSSTILPQVWGRLVRKRVFLQSVELRNDNYTFGRKPTCDIFIDGTKMTNVMLKVTSKEHFMISRDYTLVPYLKDLSKNGTYLNGKLIGQGNVLSLCDGDIIAVGHKLHEVYQYKDESNSMVSENFDKKYKITRLLGKGAFGEVYLAISKQTCHRYAVKKIEIIEKDKNKITNEINILENLQHPCVIKMIEAIYGVRGYVYIMLEYMEGGELQNRVLRQRRLIESVAKLYVYQMALAVRYLHSCGITHRDLKPENVLLGNKCQLTILKVTDFGMSKIVGDSCLMRSLCGTPLYVAPEILTADGSTLFYTPQVDVWSLGCITYFTLFGRTPFQKPNDAGNIDADEENLPQLFNRIKRGQFVIPSRMQAPDGHNYCGNSDNLSEDAVNLILQMLVLDPKKRILVDDVLAHDWFSDSKLLTTMRKLLSEEK